MSAASGFLRRLARTDEGWTFVETVIVVAIIAVLTGTVGFAGSKYVDLARRVSAATQIETLRLSLEAYYLDAGAYPTAGQGLEALWEKPSLAPVPAKWNGPYLDRRPAGDPWGNPFLFRRPGPEGLAYGISSLGADAREGGVGAAADINSWEGDR
ncbi:MAG: type II secretion system major pseudopilin GspG [Spirochaetaceae bacterium]|nr:type II secretion system major pseudopilin GspG [Spirochaetaceae bacterium]